MFIGAVFGVWFRGRNTPVVVSAESRSEAISKARNRGAAGSKGVVVAARRLKGKSLSQARKGIWVRERPNRSDPNSAQGSKYKSKFRKGPAQQSKAKT